MISVSFGAVLVLAALWFRARLLVLPYWFDESLTLHVVRQTFERMLELVFADLHVPLYYGILYGWVHVVGDSPVATGLLSFLLALGVTVLTYRIGRFVHSVEAARIAALIFWVSTSSIYFSTETRMYMLLAFITSVATLGMLQWVAGQRPARWWWVVANILGVLTHRLYFLAIVAQAIAVWVARKEVRGRISQLLWPAVLLSLVAAPIIVTTTAYYFTWYRVPGNWFASLTAGESWSGVRFWLLFPVAFFYPLDYTPSWFNLALWALLVVLLFRTVGRAMISQRMLTLSWLPDRTAVRLLAVLCLVPYAALVIFNLHPQRYIFYTMPLWSAWASVGLLTVTPLRWRKMIAVNLAVLGVALNLRYVDDVPNHLEYQWPAVGRYLETNVGQGDFILVNSFDALPNLQEHYHGPATVTAFFPPSLAPAGDLERGMYGRLGLPTINAQNISEISPLLAQRRTIWLVDAPSRYLIDPHNLVGQYIRKRCHLRLSTQVPSDQPGYDLLQFTDCNFSSS